MFPVNEASGMPSSSYIILTYRLWTQGSRMKEGDAMKLFLVPLLASLCLCTVLAQPSTEEAEAELARAVQTLQGATSYTFAYDVSPSVDATSNIIGEGQVDFATQAWQYTLQSDPSDPDADSSKNGEWITVDGTWYHNPGSGWTVAAPDFTNAGITGIIAPFASYDTLKMLGTEDSFGAAHWVGRETVDGIEADHYQFSVKDMPLYGTATYDVWIAGEGEAITHIILAATPEGKTTNTVRYSNINQPVSIEVPQ